MNTDARHVLQAQGLNKSYDEGAGTIHVLRDVNIAVREGEMVALVGASGSGKSTLLHVLGLLDEADTGRIWLNGEEAGNLSEAKRSQLRNQHLGFVYQFHHLLAEFSALDNVAMPLIVRRMPRPQAREQAALLLEQVGLSARMRHFPGQLSGGERQRVALARALVARPACVLADEPTGNLDRETAHSVFELLTKLNQESGTAFLIVTHDVALAQRAERQLYMTGGQLLDQPVQTA
ncbi:ABC transporter ATP-binding protein [Pusillimonas sp. CC-YST705]|uniref:ABC transporter ATP-binding protein n=1 Tax=Mesopusillimonas faecipullorum TaxID=2755040 RepID=A0ABS8CAB9_9BURK|nr:ABC transporter ATP-binding protein [Mesopusillimonas faecipullorum]MCB5362982.1 ABC transporter ATP-binding protein [Mesopusillimonas faecipullorum]